MISPDSSRSLGSFSSSTQLSLSHSLSLPKFGRKRSDLNGGGEDNKKFREFKQDIQLSECFARSGYPWGSKRELKILEPHAPRETLSMPGLRITNLNLMTTEVELIEIFSRYGVLGCVYLPKPLHIHLRTKDPNCGHAIIRFEDRRDAETALEDIMAKKIIVHDHVVEGEYLPPQHWPNDKSRRYY